MLAAIISRYLKENRRLVVPQLGAFLVKEPAHTLLFSQLLTKDDGVLRQLLIDDGVGEIEANGIIHRLVFDVRYAIENGVGYTLEGLGRFSSSDGVNIKFDVLPEIVVAPKVEEPAIEAAQSATESQETVIEQIIEHNSDDHQSSSDVAQPLQDSVSAKPKTKRSPKKGAKVDWWLIIGVGAIALAITVILYGFLREGARDNGDETYVEQPVLE